ncbi:MAG: hypothetical protein WBF58_24680 [Xanthobacteraceae bacterium]
MNSALVPVAPDAAESRAAAVNPRARADFVAHLIATATRLPQTRQRRRAPAMVAVAAYRTFGQWPSEAGKALSRSI